MPSRFFFGHVGAYLCPIIVGFMNNPPNISEGSHCRDLFPKDHLWSLTFIEVETPHVSDLELPYSILT